MREESVFDDAIKSSPRTSKTDENWTSYDQNNYLSSIPPGAFSMGNSIVLIISHSFLSVLTVLGHVLISLSNSILGAYRLFAYAAWF
jgi:hypothetical protein